MAIMRSLGSLGVRVYGVHADQDSHAFPSRYCLGKFVRELVEERPQDYLEFVTAIGKQLGGRALLIPTSDALSEFVAEYAGELSEQFVFPRNSAQLVKDLSSKERMYQLANAHGVPTARTEFPRSLEDVYRYADSITFPLMLKGIFGDRLFTKTGKKMVIVHSHDELIDKYRLLEDPEQPNLMIQEYIPGDDDQIYIFNGYFNEQSECLAGFTGHKIRQFPIHTGCATLGICKANQEVADITTQFMKALGYRGVLDIGYRWDPRDRKYKVLDINPRVGQAFRLFIDSEDMDVVRAMYKDFAGEAVRTGPVREGRKWIIEDFDLISCLHYYQEGTLGLLAWLRSFNGVQEGTWFSLRDPMPFLHMLGRLFKKSLLWLRKKLPVMKPGDAEIRRAESM
ncbi:MAG: hypothetical protein ACREWG_14205 [Gammaproteobacteria bacterium]